MPKFFTSNKNISDASICLDSENTKHLKTVLRAKTGDIITVCDMQGIDYSCRISHYDDNTTHLDIISKQQCQTEPQTKVTLFQGIPKLDKFDTIIEKCVELGVHEIVPVQTHRSIAKISDEKQDKKNERFNKISEAAAKQSGRGIVPTVTHACSFDAAVKEAQKLDACLIAYENEDTTSLKQFLLDTSKDAKSIGIFVGPEGGFTEHEVQAASKCGIVPITLGSRILRTETAGMNILSILMYERG